MTTMKTVRAGGARCGEHAEERSGESVEKLTGTAGKGIYEVAADEAAYQADDGRYGDRRRGLAERDAADEDHGLHTCVQRRHAASVSGNPGGLEDCATTNLHGER